jgi:SAM-dependent methyltransferase
MGFGAPGTQGYAEAARRLLTTRLAFDEVHAPILHLFPRPPSRILDIGAGPGHDAATLAAMGHSVVAIEPEPTLLDGAIRLHGRDGIRWVADALPDLARLPDPGERYAFILVSGVWMHLDDGERRRAMPRVAGLLDARGVLAISLRHGPVPRGRRMFAVEAAETIALASAEALECVVTVERNSVQEANRAAGVTWTHLAFARAA